MAAGPHLEHFVQRVLVTFSPLSGYRLNSQTHAIPTSPPTQLRVLIFQKSPPVQSVLRMHSRMCGFSLERGPPTRDYTLKNQTKLNQTKPNQTKPN